ncbi:tRNA pseudouridine(55) synthase TruB [Patescibacteria group bacterium]|nr:tRNA pseudouridine(55) synthase TruB [Patescibacteria group bacterium]
MDGFFLINKPKGITSHDVVKKVREWLKIKKVGHTGTLDPNATGLLIICISKATKLVPFLQDLSKVYWGKLVFGILTESSDEEGKILEERDAFFLQKDKVENIFGKFEGRITQIPPMFSAVHWEGNRLYDLARKGIKVRVPPREVQIYYLRLLSFFPGRHPEVEFELHCSKGTYVRSLCSDIGNMCGCGAYQKSLSRLRIGPFSLREAKKMEEVERKIKEGKIEEILWGLTQALPHLPLLKVKRKAEKLVKWGVPLYLSHLEEIPPTLEKGDKVRLCNQEEKLLAVAISLQKGTRFSQDKVGFKYLRVLA